MSSTPRPNFLNTCQLDSSVLDCQENGGDSVSDIDRERTKPVKLFLKREGILSQNSKTLDIVQTIPYPIKIKMKKKSKEIIRIEFT